MSTVVCQGLQSCLESQFVETRTRRLKLASPRPHLYESIGFARELGNLDSAPTKGVLEWKYKEINKKALNVCEEDHMSSSPDQLGGWSFLQALSNITTQSPKEALDKQSSYVPPLGKRSSSMLSEKSLELCKHSLSIKPFLKGTSKKK